jgi:hypothetical protein
MTVLQKAVNNALVFYDDVFTHRWYDAIGAGVVKYDNTFATLASDDTTGDATEWELTITEAGGGGDTTHVITDRAGGALLITTDNLENDGISMQLGAAAGENIKFDARYPCYFGIRFAINDVDQTDCLFGLSVTDTDTLGGVTDGMYFRSVDASATLNFVTEKNSIESSTSVATLADNVYVTAEFYFDGGTVYAYINGTQQTSTASSAATFPNDEEMRLTLEFLTGEAVANTLTIEWVRMIHIR